jgi:hypothetical protein
MPSRARRRPGSDYPGIMEALAQARAHARDGDLPKPVTRPPETATLTLSGPRNRA